MDAPLPPNAAIAHFTEENIVQKYSSLQPIRTTIPIELLGIKHGQPILTTWLAAVMIKPIWPASVKLFGEEDDHWPRTVIAAGMNRKPLAIIDMLGSTLPI